MPTPNRLGRAKLGGFDIGISVDIKGNLLEMMGNAVVLSPRLKQRFKDFAPFWKKQEPVMQSNFRSVWSIGQSEWQPLSPKYRIWKARHGYSTKINVMTGATKEAMVAGQLNRQENYKWTWGIDGTSPRWATTSGKPYPRYAAERRPFAVVLEETAKKITERFGDYFMKLMNRGQDNG